MLRNLGITKSCQCWQFFYNGTFCHFNIPHPIQIKKKDRTATTNKYGREAAGNNQPYTRDEITNFLDNYLKEHHSMTRRQMERALNITAYRAQKWFNDITADSSSKYYCKKHGTTYVYYRYE